MAPKTPRIRRIILDTNVLLIPGQYSLDIFSELERLIDEPYELVILQSSLAEIDRIAREASAQDRRAAKLASMLIAHQRDRAFPAASAGQCKGLKIIPSSVEEHVDDAILQIAEDDTFVATNDGGLKRRLLDKGIRVIFLKQEKYLAITE